jgi:cyd operon protein YbgT
MWYFSWILGLGLALCFGILNAIWFEVLESQREAQSGRAPMSGGGVASGGDQHPERGTGHQ